MKKFRFTTFHLAMIGLILFGIMALCIRLNLSYAVTIAMLLLIFAFVVALLYYQKATYELSEIEQIDLLNSQTEDSLKGLLDKMPVGVIKFNQETTAIEWYNPFSKLIFGNQEGEFDELKVKEIIQEKQEASTNHSLVVEGVRYHVSMDYDNGILYFYESSGENADENALSMRPVIGVISVDNYDDLTDSLSDAEVSNVNSFVAGFISEFSKNYGLFYRRVNMDRFYFYTSYAVLDRLMHTKFSILEKFREESKEAGLPLTLSMGVSYGTRDHDEIGRVSLENLNIALVRGGDQVVVKENSEHGEYAYYGGGTVSTIKRSRTRTRAMMTAISDRIKAADAVYVVGHRHLDMDALGAAVGMEIFAQNSLTKTFTVYDPDDMAPDIERAIQFLSNEEDVHLISVEDAKQQVTPQSLLIMVDHSKLSLTLSRSFYDDFSQVIVVDHHRRDDDFPSNAVLSYIESGASSASELVTELIQFKSDKTTRLSKVTASVLMAGIMLDTKQFSSRVTNRTFDVASYLRSKGSDSLLIQSISATDFNEYRQVNELVLKADDSIPHILISATESDAYSTVIASKAADRLLTLLGVEASFVIIVNQNNQVCISARSKTKVNVQRIMEQMGGGGHFNMAACQISNTTVEEVKAQLVEYLKKEIINSEVE